MATGHSSSSQQHATYYQSRQQSSTPVYSVMNPSMPHSISQPQISSSSRPVSQQVFSSPQSSRYRASIPSNTQDTHTPPKSSPSNRKEKSDWKEGMRGLFRSMATLGLDSPKRKPKQPDNDRLSTEKMLPLPPTRHQLGPGDAQAQVWQVAYPSQRPISLPVTNYQPPGPQSRPFRPYQMHPSSFHSYEPHVFIRNSELATGPLFSHPPSVIPDRPAAQQSRPSQTHFYSAPSLPTPPRYSPEPHSRTRKPLEVIDLSGNSPPHTPRKQKIPVIRHQRATSELPPSSLILQLPIASPASVKNGSPSTKSVRCSGYTRAGQPCKRLVKIEAPYLSQREPSATEYNQAKSGSGEDDEENQTMGRYCRDHAGMICKAGGFYWRGRGGKAAIWVDFNEFIPPDIGQQTATLLRMTMESPLTAKETSGFLYAYELKDMETHTTTYFKVGRTENVPRRMGEWSQQCRSHNAVLRDIFPLPFSRTPTILRARHPNHQAINNRHTSYLPGAMNGGTSPSMNQPHTGQSVAAVKRWEKLVHLELAERASRSACVEWERIRMGKKGGAGCDDCGAVHREIFPLGHAGGKAYEEVVIEVISRWERFIRRITDD